MKEFGGLEHVLTQLLENNIIVGPAFASLTVGGLDPEVYEIIRHEARVLSLQYWRRHHSLLIDGGPVASNEVVEQALCEAISSTAAYLSHLRLGHLNVDETMVRVALSLIENFLNEHHVEETITVALLVHAYDDYQALVHYREMKEIDFITGQLHRPWIQYTLEGELEFLLYYGSLRRYDCGKTPYLALTEVGESRYERIRKFLEEAGFLQRRRTLARWSQFSQMEDYDDIVNQIGMEALRYKTLELSGITSDMHVLELGCGTAGLTIDAGLCRVVGSGGSVIATDPSVGMLSRARKKAEKLNVENTSFRQSAAEHLPFEDNTFDAIIGVSFLHFTRIPDALQEIHRVAKPNAFFTTLYPLHVPDSNPYFGEWFAPLLINSPGSSSNSDMLPGKDTVASAIPNRFYTDIDIQPVISDNDYGNPEAVVKFYVQVVNVFEPVMNTLPWKAQQEMIQTLVERGRDIVAKYGRVKLRLQRPFQSLKARVVK